MVLKTILQFLPEVKKPSEKKVSFNTKLTWTLIVLVAFFTLANIPLYGLASNSLERFEYLATIIAADFGSLVSLGIGPLVMSSIVLQLLVGAGILSIDTKTEEGKKYFQGLQKLGVIFFIIFEAIVYVAMGGLQAVPGYTTLLMIQLIMGGFIVMLLDDVSTKWGFGSGVSLFIVSGVAWQLFTGLFQFIDPVGGNCLTNFAETACTGRVLIIIQALLNSAPTEALTAFATIAITALVFVIAVWAQSLKVEIPLTYDRLRGYGVKWPLAFFYAANIPVILTAALAANVQLFAGLLENALGHPTILGGFSNGVPISGVAYWLGSSNIIEALIRGSITSSQIFQAIAHLVIYMAFSVMFAIFWVKTAGLDANSQAKNIISSGLQIPGFRKDERVLESILSRYILPLTVMGGLAIGALASFANLLGALTSGTSILLAVMITYQLYQNIAQQHALDMHPALRKFVA